MTFFSLVLICRALLDLLQTPNTNVWLSKMADLPAWGVLTCMGYIGICWSKGYGLSAILVIQRILILAILVINRVVFLHSSLELGSFF